VNKRGSELYHFVHLANDFIVIQWSGCHLRWRIYQREDSKVVNVIVGPARSAQIGIISCSVLFPRTTVHSILSILFIRRTTHPRFSLGSSRDTQKRSAGPKIPQVLPPVPSRVAGMTERPQDSSLWQLRAQTRVDMSPSTLCPSYLRAL